MNPENPEKLLKFKEIDGKVTFSEGKVRAFPETLSKKLEAEYKAAIEELMRKVKNASAVNAFGSFLQSSEAPVGSGAIERLREQKKILWRDMHQDAQQLMVDINPSFDLETKLMEEEESYIELIKQLFDLEFRLDYLHPDARVAALENLIEDLRREERFVGQYKHMFATTDPKNN